MPGTLVLVRHGQSEWNLQNLFTGWRDPDLTEQGREEAKTAGTLLKMADIAPDIYFTSMLQRAQKTAHIILQKLNKEELDANLSLALNERDYGDLTGLNKADCQEKWGEEQVKIWRRSYNIAPPNGESLRDTLARVLPYYLFTIQPYLLKGQNVFIVAHGNSLRALMMAIEGLTPEQIVKQEIATATPIIYEFDNYLQLQQKRVLTR